MTLTSPSIASQNQASPPAPEGSSAASSEAITSRPSVPESVDSRHEQALTTLIDADAAEALAEILDEPSLPVGSVVTGGFGARFNPLREAHDFLSTHRLVAFAGEPDSSAGDLIAALTAISPELAGTLQGHAELVALLGDVEPSRGRNALLGDVRRGGLLGWATTVGLWSWYGGTQPSATAPLQRGEGELVTDHHPALYDTIVFWEPEAEALIALPPLPGPDQLGANR